MNDTPRYYGGRTVHDSTVRRLEARSFRQLVESRVFVPVSFALDRKAFLDHPERDKLKDGDYLVAATYDADESPRDKQNVTGFGLVIIDLDGGSAARDFAEGPHSIAEALHPYNFVAWQTAKHTPEEPRLKVMVDIAPSDPDLYRKTLQHIVGLLGLPAGYKGASDSAINQPQYRPIHFQGETYAAVIASRLDGKALDPSSLAEIDPDLDDFPYAYQPKEGEPSDTGDILSHPVTGLPDDPLTYVRDALFQIDPDIEYPKWAQLAAALRHQFTEEDDAREAYCMFDEWSATGSKYRGHEETLAKWRSFKPYPVGRAPVTLRTLFHYALAHGWDSAKLTQDIAITFEQWCAEQATDVLRGEGVRRIAGLAVRSEMTEEQMATALAAQLKSGGVVVSKQAILKDAKRQRKAERLDAAKQAHPAWLSPFCFVGPANVFRNLITGIEYTPEAFNNTFGRNTAEDENAVPPSLYALNVAQIKVVDRVIYDPRERSGRDPYFERGNLWFCNSFRSSSVPAPSPVHGAEARSLVRALLKANIANKDHRRAVLDYLAYCVQHPGEKIRWSILLQGAQGCGKGTLIDTVRTAIGEANFKVITGSALTSDFNEWREGSHLCYVDELFSAGSNRHEINNKMKDAITNTFIPVNRKFKDITNIPNVTNYFLSTNKHDALVLEETDRRYMILKSLLQSKDEVEAFKDLGVMEKIHELIKSAPGAFRWMWLNHKISESFNPNGHAPDTEFRQELVDQGKNPLLVMIEDLIEDETQPLIGADLIHYGVLEALTSIAARNNARPSHYLHMLGYRAVNKGKPLRINGEKVRVYAHGRRFVEGLDDPIELMEERIEKI